MRQSNFGDLDEEAAIGENGEPVREITTYNNNRTREITTNNTFTRGMTIDLIIII